MLKQMTTWEKREGLLFYFYLFSYWGHSAGLAKPRTARHHLLLPSKMRSHQWIRRKGQGTDQITGLPSSNQTWMFCYRSPMLSALLWPVEWNFFHFEGEFWKKKPPLPSVLYHPPLPKYTQVWCFISYCQWQATVSGWLYTRLWSPMQVTQDKQDEVKLLRGKQGFVDKETN